MTRPDDNSKNSVNISGSGNVIGGIAQGSGSRVDAVNVNVHPVNANAPSQQLFDELQRRVDALEDAYDKQMAQLAVNGLKEELGRGENAEEDKLQRRLDAIRSTLGDAIEVATATIASPAAGFALVAQKVAAKARE